MKKIIIFIVTTMTVVMASAGYTASTEGEESMDHSSSMEKCKGKSGMMDGMHGKEKMHEGMMGNHMMHSGVSPVTIMIHPGMMPMMDHGKMKKDDHKGDEMDKDKMKQRHEMMKGHMKKLEQRLANIEALLGELVEMQSQN